jgi:hypothetical protein
LSIAAQSSVSVLVRRLIRKFDLADEIADGNIEAGIYWEEQGIWLEEPEAVIFYADCRSNVYNQPTNQPTNYTRQVVCYRLVDSEL